LREWVKGELQLVRDMAERDAWYVFGVEHVINRIDVKA
jgi:osmotically-inducible protein OsmY